ncbi:MAG: hypothetical protein NT001_04885 [Candidatus Woesearchaeota archaeon]|nr:hypothetical protein [Candidatus Woesearchaeota archaeon]
MKTQDVELIIETEEISLLPDIKKALDELDIILAADYEGIDKEYRQRMKKGRAEIHFFKDKSFVADDVKGRLMMIDLGTSNELIPPVSAKGLEGLCSPYEVHYNSGNVQIVKRGDSPIRYQISTMHE